MFENADGKTVVTKREDISMDKSDNDIKVIENDGYYEEEPEQHVEGTESVNIIYESANADALSEYTAEIQTASQMSDHQHHDEQIVIAESQSSDKKRKVEDHWDSFEDDEFADRYYAMSVACELKKLKRSNSLMAKAEILQIIEKYVRKEEKQ